MTTKFLYGAHPLGYVLNGLIYTGLVIEPSATVGGPGVEASFSASIANYGSVNATSGYGVDLGSGGTVTNGSASDTTALISGPTGVLTQNASATVTNFGTIQTTFRGFGGPDGVHLGTGGTVTNGSASDTTALISGYIAVY